VAIIFSFVFIFDFCANSLVRFAVLTFVDEPTPMTVVTIFPKASMPVFLVGHGGGLDPRFHGVDSLPGQFFGAVPLLHSVPCLFLFVARFGILADAP